ncbi:MAG: DMT family transporter [Bacteroidales bacterium]|nr:DMT family transporter [Bacteroidales bacterium]
MKLFGETLSLFVALSWTVTALFAEVGSKRMGSLAFNAIRMTMSLVMFCLALWLMMGTPYPRYADGDTWLWLLLSGLVGYVIGDYCLMQGYILIGSRFGQLFMTLSAPSAAIVGRLFLGEEMRPIAIVGMIVTIGGIAMSILSKDNDTSTQQQNGGRLKLNLPVNGIVYACGAGICQGIGLVLSKVGLLHYDASLSAAIASGTVESGVLDVPWDISIAFASTMIRGLMGLTGFLLLMMLLKNERLDRLRSAVRDRKAMWCAAGSMLFGPFIGVSVSLMATRYTATGIAQTLFALTPVLIIAPAAWLFHQKVRVREVIGAIVSVCGAALFFLF